MDGDGLRGLVLSGQAPAELWASFLLAEGAEGYVTWFGSAGFAALAGNPPALRYAVDRDVLAIDRMIGAQLDQILHHPRLQTLEGSWRGLWWLIDQLADGPGDRIVIRMMNATWRDIARDMDRADNYDDSHLFHEIHDSEFGMAGGEPFGLLLIDHAVRHRPDRANPTDDKAILEHLARIGTAAFAPIVIAAAAALLGVDHFAELAATRRPAAALADSDHGRWRGLGEQTNSRFLAVVLPRVMARAPWTDDGSRDDGFGYREAAASVADRTWMSGGYCFAAVVARAAARFGWPADVRGADPDRVGGGLVTGLPAEPHVLSRSLSLPRLPIEVVFTAGQERALIEAGLMPLGALPHTDALLFGGVRSLYRPQPAAGPAAAAAFADSRVATQINAVLCAARFAHFLKIRGRQAIGRLRRAEDVEQELRGWLTGFVNRNTLATAETRAAHPLYDAAVRVTEQPGKPGVFECEIDLQPYFQLDNVTASFSFATEITAPAA